MPSSSIIIVDDHPLVRSGFRHLIDTTADLRVSCEASTIKEALKQTIACKPDLAVIDLSLPDGSGLDLIKRLLLKCPKLLILVVSMHEEMLYLNRCMQAGASGYINKQEASEQIIDAIRQILKGHVYTSSGSKTDHASLHDAEKRPSLDYVSPVAKLSDRELEIFELIGHGMSTSDIARSLFLSIKTIESHRANIKSKLGLFSGGELIRRAIQWTLSL